MHATQIVPFDRLPTLPPDLDGSHGTNRAPEGLQLRINTDIEAILLWLSEFESSPDTYRSYRREAERLFIWAINVLGRPISSLNRTDFDAYAAFLDQPPEAWCTNRATRRDSDAWRPFEGPLNARSKHHALTVLNAMLSWLTSARYIAGNPLSLMRRKNKRTIDNPNKDERAKRREKQELLEQQQRITHFLPIDTFLWLLSFIETMPSETPREIERKARAKFGIVFLEQTGLRLTEFCMARMSDIYCDKSGWWISVLGKGDKLGRVPLPETAMQALADYRVHRGLPAYPAFDDTCPLLGNIRDGQTVEPGSFYDWIKRFFKMAAGRATAEGKDIYARQIGAASTHWMRHSAASHQIDAGIPIKVVQLNLRHANLATTSEYVHASDEAQHFETTSRMGDLLIQKPPEL